MPAVNPSIVNVSAVTPLAVTPLAVTPLAVTPLAVTPSAATQPATTPSAAICTGADLPAAIHPSAAPPSATLPAYAEGQPAARVDAALRQSLAVCDSAQQCAVLWFAEVWRRALHAELGHASLQLYATEGLGFSENRYWQFRRLAEDLERLPAVREAVATGQIGWTKAQQIARVATPQTQHAWVAQARAHGRRELAAEVRATRRRADPRRAKRAPAAQLSLGGTIDPRRPRDGEAGAAPSVNAPSSISAVDAAAGLTVDVAGSPTTDVAPSPAAAAATGATANAPTYTVTLRFDALQLARFEALLEAARRSRVLPCAASNGDFVLAGLVALVEGGPQEAQPGCGTSAAGPDERRSEKRPHPARPAAQIIVQQCPACAAAAVVTRRGELPLVPAQVAASRCDARRREPGGPNRATIPPSVRAAVLARDRHRCATPGCGATGLLEVHHVDPRHRGGSNRPENLVTLCSRCHIFAHERGAIGQASASQSAPTHGLER